MASGWPFALRPSPLAPRSSRLAHDKRERGRSQGHFLWEHSKYAYVHTFRVRSLPDTKAAARESGARAQTRQRLTRAVRGGGLAAARRA